MAQEISARELVAEMAKASDFALLDVRSARAFRRGHLPGAISVPYASFDVGALPQEVVPGRPVVVYCYVGVASAKVADMLGAAGFGEVRSLAKGHAAWRFAKGAPRDVR